VIGKKITKLHITFVKSLRRIGPCFHFYQLCAIKVVQLLLSNGDQRRTFSKPFLNVDHALKIADLGEECTKTYDVPCKPR
jgi:hypothetical protein